MARYHDPMLKTLLVWTLIAMAMTAGAVVVLMLMNARDPYGGPIEEPEA